MKASPQNTLIKKAKDLTISSSVLISMITSGTIMQSCQSGQEQNGAEGSYEEVESYTKGVKTYIKETAPGIFKIDDEQQTDVDSSMVQVKYLDGRQEQLNASQVQSLIDKNINENRQTIGKDESLANALLYSGMGYLLAKTLSPNYSQYRPDMNPELVVNKQDTTRRTKVYHNRAHFFPLLFYRFYNSPAVFERSNMVHNGINNSRMVSYRPVGGRSGFFRSTGRSSFRA